MFEPHECLHGVPFCADDCALLAGVHGPGHPRIELELLHKAKLPTVGSYASHAR